MSDSIKDPGEKSGFQAFLDFYLYVNQQTESGAQDSRMVITDQ